MDIVGDGGLAGGAGDTDEAQITSGMAVVGGKKFGFGAAETEPLGLRFGLVPVAQLDRALACGAKGQRFESSRVYHRYFGNP